MGINVAFENASDVMDEMEFRSEFATDPESKTFVEPTINLSRSSRSWKHLMD